MTAVEVLLFFGVNALAFVGGIRFGWCFARAGVDMDRHVADSLRLIDEDRRAEAINDAAAMAETAHEREVQL